MAGRTDPKPRSCAPFGTPRRPQDLDPSGIIRPLKVRSRAGWRGSRSFDAVSWKSQSSRSRLRALDGPCSTEGVGEMFEDGGRLAKIELASDKAEILPVTVLREIVRRVRPPSRGLTRASEDGAPLSESLGPTCMPALTARFREA